MADTLPNIHHSLSTMDEIRSALNAGKEVTTHTDAVSVPGWSGAGYLIIDPETGVGAYKIRGGGNGGYLDVYNGGPISAALFITGLLTLLAASSTLLPIFIVALFVINVFHSLILYMQTSLILLDNGCPEELSQLYFKITMSFLVLPRFIRAPILSLVYPFLSFIAKNAIKGTSGACKI